LVVLLLSLATHILGSHATLSSSQPIASALESAAIRAKERVLCDCLFVAMEQLLWALANGFNPLPAAREQSEQLLEEVWTALLTCLLANRDPSTGHNVDHTVTLVPEKATVFSSLASRMPTI
jgi:hypothetical protein